MKTKFIVEKGFVAAASTANIDTIKINNPVKIFDDFQMDKLICTGNVFKEDGVLICEADIPNSYLNKYPSIGFIADNGIQSLMVVALCSEQNEDPSILTIKDQSK